MKRAGVVRNNSSNNRDRTKSLNGHYGQGQQGQQYGYGHGQLMNYGTHRLNHSNVGSTSTSKYYAGAKFESIPQLTDLPVPPSHWTSICIGDGPAATGRSQSTPSSPITIVPPTHANAQSTNRLFKSASVPLDRPFVAVAATAAPVPKPKKVVGRQNGHSGPNGPHRPANGNGGFQKKKDKEISGSDLMAMLLKASTSSPVKNSASCQGQLSQATTMTTNFEYKEITDNLKSLLKVSAA